MKGPKPFHGHRVQIMMLHFYFSREFVPALDAALEIAFKDLFGLFRVISMVEQSRN